MRRRGHSLFGRGRGNGTGPRTATTLCTGCGEYWNAAGARKGAVGSSERALRTLGDFWMEPVSSSLADSCFSPLPIFRSANMLNTRIARAIMLEQRPAARSLATHHKDARIGRAPKREEARCAFRRPTGREILQAPA
jgi:hypothetical protein